MGSVIQMFAASTGGNQSALAQVDIPMNGLLTGVDWIAKADFDTTADDATWQLSFGSELTVANDSRQVISMITCGAIILATAVGAMAGKANKFVALPDIPVAMGERLFLHSIAAAAVVGDVFCLLHFSFDMSQASARRR